MITVRLKVDPTRLAYPEESEAIARAAWILRTGGLVALPTETVYGLGANALDPEAVGRIFAAKLRPSWDPVIVHIAGSVTDNHMLEWLVTRLPRPAEKLIESFWPGPLTLLLPRSRIVPDEVTAGRPLVGIRMPAHPVAAEVIARSGVPIAAPSANLFSHISPTTADHVLEDLDGRIDAILDAGPTSHGVESTVLDPCQTPMVIYRPGAITADMIREVAGPVELFEPGAALHLNPSSAAGQMPNSEPRESLPSPGVGLRHYAPQATLVLVEAPLAQLAERIHSSAARFPTARLGIMLPAELSSCHFPGATIFPWGSWSAPEDLARSLFSGLRSLDAHGCTVIVCPLPAAEGIGAAIRDRLSKAAAGPI